MATNEYVTHLDDLEFFQGDTVTIPFEFYDGENNPIDLTMVKVYWYLCPYGRFNSPAVVLDSFTLNSEGLTDIIINQKNKNVCYVNLNQEITKNLNYIKYTQQPVVVLTRGSIIEKYIRAEGNIIFKPAIKNF